jgi:hypothetical protein
MPVTCGIASDAEFALTVLCGHIILKKPKAPGISTVLDAVESGRTRHQVVESVFTAADERNDALFDESSIDGMTADIETHVRHLGRPSNLREERTIARCVHKVAHHIGAGSSPDAAYRP